MALEDAASLGRVFARAKSAQCLPQLTKLFEEIRKERAYEVQARSALNGRIWHCESGRERVKRGIATA